jgi:hypothetical protein
MLRTLRKPACRLSSRRNPRFERTIRDFLQFRVERGLYLQAILIKRSAPYSCSSVLRISSTKYGATDGSGRC